MHSVVISLALRGIAILAIACNVTYFARSEVTLRNNSYT